MAKIASPITWQYLNPVCHSRACCSFISLGPSLVSSNVAREDKSLRIDSGFVAYFSCCQLWCSMFCLCTFLSWVWCNDKFVGCPFCWSAMIKRLFSSFCMWSCICWWMRRAIAFVLALLRKLSTCQEQGLHRQPGGVEIIGMVHGLCGQSPICWGGCCWYVFAICHSQGALRCPWRFLSIGILVVSWDAFSTILKNGHQCTCRMVYQADLLQQRHWKRRNQDKCSWWQQRLPMPVNGLAVWCMLHRFWHSAKAWEALQPRQMYSS
jgi:hypothetical protein